MTSVDIEASVPRPVVDRGKPKQPARISKQIKDIIELMVTEGKPWNVAAPECGISNRQMRLALDRPAVMQYLMQRKQVFRQQASAANIHRLVAIRDAADNMPAVNAIKELEAMGEDRRDGGRAGLAAAPGFTIQLIQHVTGAPAPVTIEHKADE